MLPTRALGRRFGSMIVRRGRQGAAFGLGVGLQGQASGQWCRAGDVMIGVGATDPRPRWAVPLHSR